MISRKRRALLVSAVTLGLLSTVTFGTAWANDDNADIIVRYEGGDRYETAVAISNAGFPGKATTVFLASGADFSDALSAAPAATIRKAPLLLVAPDQVPESVVKEITRLQPSEIIIVGGTVQ